MRPDRSSASATPNESLSPARRSADDALRKARGRFVRYYFVWALLLPVGIAQAWFAQARRHIAYTLPDVENQISLVRSHIDQLHIESESLKALANVDAMASRLGFVRPELPPIVLAPLDPSRVPGPSASSAAGPTASTTASAAPTTQAGLLPLKVPFVGNQSHSVERAAPQTEQQP
ncbi:hypothetical protein FJZ36_03345 [Candidatus Poribacteria bacterium]|nr:hypothetical protein [Candidatus Poribacteria bacterium]